MASKALPSPEVLRQLLRYEPETGKLFWLPREPHWFSGELRSAAHSAAIWNARYAGQETFRHRDRKGYPKGTIFDATFRAHRVAWAIHYGAWPLDQLDHVNMDRSDNRIVNLREADNSQNNQNRGPMSNNKSGFKGVFWDTRRGRWVAALQVRGQLFRGGAFLDPQAAAQSYEALCRKHHGAFSRLQ